MTMHPNCRSTVGAVTTPGYYEERRNTIKNRLEPGMTFEQYKKKYYPND
jgi:hypothetical protein